MTVKGKKILVLGGALYQEPVIHRAQELGCYVILADINPDAPGRNYADAFEHISTTNKEMLLDAAERHEIDGVMTYASESSVESVAFVAERLGLKGNPEDASEVITKKDLFRNFQSQHNLPHPRFVNPTTLAEAIDATNDLSFPVVIKPVDSAGTRGQSVIYGHTEIVFAFEKARKHSKEGTVIIEEFVNGDMMELDGDVLFNCGQLVFRHYGHNHFLKNRISNVPSGEIFPGLFAQDVEEQLDWQFSTLIRELGLRDGCMNFDGFVSKGIVHIIDVGLRNGGNFVPELIQLSTGFDLTAAAIYSALGTNYAVPWLKCPDPKPVASYIVGSRFHGRYEGVDFDKELEPYVVEFRPYLKPNEEIVPFTRSDLAAGIVFFRFPSMKVLLTFIDQIENMVKLRISPIHPNPLDIARRPAVFKDFEEQISPFLRQKIAHTQSIGDDKTLRVLTREFVETVSETNVLSEGLKHYEAEEEVVWEEQPLNGIERLYRRVILFELVQQCASRCRYCLRRNYKPWNHSKEDVLRAARFIGKAPGHEELTEVLVTGGDPGIVPDKLGIFLDELSEYAPHIAVVRVATRVPIHQPDLVNDRLLEVLSKKRSFRLEIATQINHSVELFPEVENAYRRLLEIVPLIYNQPVMLKGINDSLDELIELFDRTRLLGIENHYFFHCVPIGGLESFRVSLVRALNLARQISQSGCISGRAKPKFALMTGIGKIIPYEGSILEQKERGYLLRSDYTLKDRLQWNPSWQVPSNAFVDGSGHLCIWYQDSEE